MCKDTMVYEYGNVPQYCHHLKVLFQPFVFSPVFELIYVSDLFLVLDLRVISTFG